MSSNRWSRRTFLGGLGLSTALLPNLIAEQTARAAAAPKRFVVINVPNGVRRAAYWPTGGENDFVIKTDAQMDPVEKYSPLQPLIPFRDDMIFMGGIVIQNSQDCGNTNGHHVLPHILTGTHGGECPYDQNNLGPQAMGPSVDRFIGKTLRERHNLRYDSLVIKATERTETYANDGFLSFDGPPIGGLPNAPSQFVSPVALFDDLFGDGQLTEAELKRLRVKRKSVLDLVGRDLEGFGKRLGTEDRMRIEQHLTSVRAVERQLVAGACGEHTLEEFGLSRSKNYVVGNGNPNQGAAMRAQMDLTAIALACDATRVASLLWPEANGSNTVFSWLGEEFNVVGGEMSGGGLITHHELAHREDAESEFRKLINRGCQWHLEEVANLLTKLSMEDVDGKRMLDNTVVLFMNCQRTGSGHENWDLPWILAGNCGGYFKTGRYLEWPSGTPDQSVPQNGILAAIANAMDCPVDHYGSPDYGGELTRLKA